MAKNCKIDWEVSFSLTLTKICTKINISSSVFSRSFVFHMIMKRFNYNGNDSFMVPESPTRFGIIFLSNIYIKTQTRK